MPASVQIKIDQDTVTKGLPRFRKGAIDTMRKQIHATGLLVHGTARLSLITGPKTGRVYKRRGITHRASAPGQTPASDTGNLLAHINITYGRDYADVGATVVHGRHLEFREPAKGGRVWLRKAYEKHVKRIEANIVDGLAKL
jgi:hypothetical protein